MVFRFQQMRVKTRIYFGFGLLIALATSVALIGITRLLAVQTNVGIMNEASESATRMRDTAVQLETTRRSLLRYRTYTDADALTSTRESLAKATGLIGQAAAAAVSQDQLRTFAGLQDDLRGFGGLVDKVVQLQTEIFNQRAALFAVGDELTAVTEKLVQNVGSTDDIAVSMTAAATEKAILLVRFANWRFLATLDPKGPATFKINHEKAEAALAGLEVMLDNELRKLVGPVRTALKAYVTSFDRNADATLAIGTLFSDEIVPRIVGMQKQLENVRRSLTDSFTNSKQASDATIANATLLQSVLTAVALLLGIASALVIGRSIVNPLTRITTTMTKLSSGDTSVTIPLRDGHDEIGDIARAVEVFKESMINTASLAAAQAQEQSAKTARQSTINEYISSFDCSIRDLLNTLGSSAADMRTAAESMLATADQTNQQASSVSVAAGQASANVQTMATATEEMASSAVEITRQVARSASIASRAVEAARNTDKQVQGLADMAQKIEAVVAIINGIASQTNLLALNATIEAARAGDAGKGFAVVASEVKALAGLTGKATEEIGAQIQAIQGATQSAVDAIKSIGVTIDEINDISTAIAAAMEEQGATTSDMTRSTHQAAQGTQEVSTTIERVSQGASATGAAASQVVSAVNALDIKTVALQTEVGSFLDRIRAA